MLQGPLLTKILIFALPLAASSLMQQLFNSIDVAVVGHFASNQALAAVGSNAPIINIIVTLFVGLSVGVNVVIANYIGQRNSKAIAQAINTTTVIVVAGSVLVTLLGLILSRPMLEMVDTPSDVIGLAEVYLNIFFLGMPFIMIFNFGAAILRSKGDTKRPLYILALAGIINIALNVLLVVCFDMSVAGVAIATDVANAVSAFSIMRLLMKEEEPFRLYIKEMKINRKELHKIARIGIPAGLQGMVFSISNVSLLTAINSYGSIAAAGSAAAINFEFYCYFLVNSFGAAATTFIGQNYAAHQFKRCKRVFWVCMALSVFTCASCNFLFTWQSKACLQLFTADPAVISYGITRMGIVLAWQWLASSYEISGSCLRGMGYSILPAVLTVFGTCALRLVWVFSIERICHDFAFLLAIYPITWVVTGTMVWGAYTVITRKAMKKLHPLNSH